MKKEANPSNPKSKKVPMIVISETIRDFEINPDDVTWTLIGNRKCQVIMIDANEAVYRAYMDPVWAEAKREERDGRCLISGKNGKLIRCPESRKCADCELYSEVCKERNRMASLSLLADEGAEPASKGSFEDDVMYEMILEDLIAMLSEKKPEYGSIFRMLYDGATQKEMAAELGMNERTVSDYVKAVRKIVQPRAKDIFDR